MDTSYRMVVFLQRRPGGEHAQSWDAHRLFLRGLWCTLAPDGAPLPFASTRLADRRALGIDAGHQIVPGLDEGRSTLVLEPAGQPVHVHTRLVQAGHNR